MAGGNLRKQHLFEDMTRQYLSTSKPEPDIQTGPLPNGTDFCAIGDIRVSFARLRDTGVEMPLYITDHTTAKLVARLAKLRSTSEQAAESADRT